MTIERNSISQYKLARVGCDMVAERIDATLIWLVDGIPCGNTAVEVVGDEFHALLTALPEPGISRATDIRTMVEAYVIAKGLIQGEAN